MKNNKFNIVSAAVIAGAFISYTVGSGFASGNEVLKFFGSWGMPASILAIVGATLITLVSCACLYKIGSKISFDTTSDAYYYVGGKYLGKFFQLFTFVSIFGTFMIMFSGAGSVLSQFWNMPVWVGSVIMGVLSGIVVLGGLSAVEKVLGSIGIILLVYVLVFGVASLFTPSSDMSQASGIPEAVAAGAVTQANLFALPPLSFIPALANLNSPFLEGMLYAALCMVNGVPFIMALGKKTNSTSQAFSAALITTIGFYACVVFVLILILMNFDVVINPQTNIIHPFPVLAAVDKIWHSGSWTYVILIFAGIFTTTTGFLWVLSEWLFPGEVRTKKTNTFIIVMIIFGICLGSVLPFSTLINFIFPLSGLVGLMLTVCLIIRTVQLNNTAKPTEK